ncbi:MAG: hypothetical protein IT381_14180, partial [Deltaproteobacteria bacterium]|nr:hypothetical protein [Deltaproteobacteria bacterium]
MPKYGAWNIYARPRRCRPRCASTFVHSPANHRLHAACLQLGDAEFKATRSGFFPSLWATLNQILIVDWYYIAALHGEADMRRAFRSDTPFDEMAAVSSAQQVSDERLIAWCERADDAALNTE